ncbi:MAG: mitochondrial fission ELM1 family protein, partial [Pseudomonadota bacterium]
IDLWVITEGMAGTENQCLGVAQALGIQPEVKRIDLTFPWNVLSPFLGFEKAHSFTPTLKAPWPDLVIASGRKAIAACRFIKKQSKGKTKIVFLQDPRVKADEFDLVAVPHHDKLRGENVIVTDGAPNKINQKMLEEAKKEFSPAFSRMKSPRVAVLIGGNSKTHQLTEKTTKKLCDELNALDGSLMITASRRTGEENQKIIQNECDKPQNFIWNGNGNNPYLGMLAWADFILVTSDSTSMISDAATTGKPVHVIPLEGSSPKFDRFYSHLKSKNLIRDFEGKLENWDYTALNDSEKVAQAIKRSRS